ncbi:MAG TPA: diaminopropionate ammonia-lyase [Vicinamibacterales bacterium]|nr:diaminopropionate ammonia-lyase [Vicinamibacterales bacterium]
MPVAFVNPHHDAVSNLFRNDDFAAQRAFFAARPALAPTPLRDLPALAHTLGITGLAVKDETARFGLNAFKAVGATYAVQTLRARGDIAPGQTLVCASEGNHGRAVARAAREAGCPARVYVAASVAAPRVAAIESEYAEVVRIDGSYDDAVRVMAQDAVAHGWMVISDTSWQGYEEIPRLIMLGYTRLLDEAESQWGAVPDVIFVQGGVGGLLAAVASWADWRYGSARPRIVAVEPMSAACLQVSAQHGRPTSLSGPFDTVMGGLRCGEVSTGAFDAVRTLVDGFVAIEDDWALDAIRALATPSGADPAINAGASGAAALGGLLAALGDPQLADLRARIRLSANSRVLVLVTEGVTDPEVYARALARG